MGENKKVMKKIIIHDPCGAYRIGTAAAAVSAAYYKTIPGNLVKGGESTALMLLITSG